MNKIRKYIFWTVCVIVFFSCKTETKKVEPNYIDFKLNIKLVGESNGGRLHLWMDYTIDTTFYGTGFKANQTKFENGIYQFAGRIASPCLVNLHYIDSLKKYSSVLIFIEPREMNAVLRICGDSLVLISQTTRLNEEYNDIYLKQLSPITIERENLIKMKNDTIEKYLGEFPESFRRYMTIKFKNIKIQEDRTLMNFIRLRPNSEVGLWLIAKDFSLFAYKKTHEDSFRLLSDSIKNTYVGKLLKEKMNYAKTNPGVFSPYYKPPALR